MACHGAITVFTTDVERSRSFYRRLFSAEAGESPTRAERASAGSREGGAGIEAVGLPGPFDFRWCRVPGDADTAGSEKQVAAVDSVRLIVLVNSMSLAVEAALAGGGVVRAFLNKAAGRGAAHVLIQDPDNVLLELIAAAPGQLDGHETARVAAVGIASRDFDATITEFCAGLAFMPCADRFQQGLVWPGRPGHYRLQTLQRGRACVVVSQHGKEVLPLLAGARCDVEFTHESPCTTPDESVGKSHDESPALTSREDSHDRLCENI